MILGVISGVGKGIIASSTGLLLKTLGLSVTYIKIDPYMNIDAGTMAPTEFGSPSSFPPEIQWHILILRLDMAKFTYSMTGERSI